MENKGYWELVSPLPDCPAGTKGESIGNDYWNFHYPDGKDCITYHEAAIRRNPAIFRWVQEPERVEWPEHKAIGLTSAAYSVNSVIVRCESKKQAFRVLDMNRLVLQALREGKTIYSAHACVSHTKERDFSLEAIICPDGSRP